MLVLREKHRVFKMIASESEITANIITLCLHSARPRCTRMIARSWVFLSYGITLKSYTTMYIVFFFEK